MKELKISATLDNVTAVTEFVDGLLEQNDCPMKPQMQIDIAIDEIFSNIARYAYGNEIGEAVIKAGLENDGIFVIEFIDSGVPYNPLLKPDPDTTLSADERSIGGLGIYMVKKSMDDMLYEYTDGHNVLTLKKKII